MRRVDVFLFLEAFFSWLYSNEAELASETGNLVMIYEWWIRLFPCLSIARLRNISCSRFDVRYMLNDVILTTKMFLRNKTDEGRQSLEPTMYNVSHHQHNAIFFNYIPSYPYRVSTTVLPFFINIPRTYWHGVTQLVEFNRNSNSHFYLQGKRDLCQYWVTSRHCCNEGSSTNTFISSNWEI